MKIVDRFMIQQDLAALTEALQGEQFLKSDDPSVSVLNFLEKVANATGAIKHLYAKDAADRNKMVGPVREQIADIKAACEALEQSLSAVKDSPEDNDSELPSDDEA